MPLTDQRQQRRRDTKQRRRARSAWRLLRWQVGLHWYLFVLFGLPVGVLLSAIVCMARPRSGCSRGTGACSSRVLAGRRRALPARQPVGGPAEPCTDRSCFIPGRRSSVEVVDHRKDVRDFLVSRRARVSPEQAGLPSYGGKRRVPGLRREEVAMLAGLSVDYYGRLERGNLAGASESVLEAVARALQLDDAERQHLFDLARHTEPPRSAAAAPAEAGGRAAAGGRLDPGRDDHDPGVRADVADGDRRRERAVPGPVRRRRSTRIGCR